MTTQLWKITNLRRPRVTHHPPNTTFPLAFPSKIKKRRKQYPKRGRGEKAMSVRLHTAHQLADAVLLVNSS